MNPAGDQTLMNGVPIQMLIRIEQVDTALNSNTRVGRFRCECRRGSGPASAPVGDRPKFPSALLRSSWSCFAPLGMGSLRLVISCCNQS